MPILSKKLTHFDKEDVELLDEMLNRFATLKGETKLGKTSWWSPDNVAYFPVLALALLKSQKTVQTLTWALVGLTAVLAILTGVLIAGI